MDAGETPITGLEELDSHIQALLKSPDIPLNATLFDEVGLQLTGTLVSWRGCCGQRWTKVPLRCCLMFGWVFTSLFILGWEASGRRYRVPDSVGIDNAVQIHRGHD
jgi:hypothetical protein